MSIATAIPARLVRPAEPVRPAVDSPELEPFGVGGILLTWLLAAVGTIVTIIVGVVALVAFGLALVYARALLFFGRRRDRKARETKPGENRAPIVINELRPQP